MRARPSPTHPASGFRKFELSWVVGCRSQVQPIAGKGLGVIAKVTLEANAVAAYYLCKLLPKGGHASRLAVTSASGDTMDITSGSFPPPEEGIPYIGPYANEPTGINGQPNCVLRSFPILTHEGRLRRFALITLSEVRTGEELVWDYGPLYGPRAYESRYNV